MQHISHAIFLLTGSHSMVFKILNRCGNCVTSGITLSNSAIWLQNLFLVFIQLLLLVKAGYNTSTVALRVVEGSGKGIRFQGV